jgi:4-aminobutyrate aminotransferase
MPTDIDSTTLYERHRRVLPAWVHTYYDDEPLELIEGHHHTVVDATGAEYLDCFGGILTTSIGYDVAELREAIERQLASGIVHTSTLYLIRNQVVLAERIAARSPISDPKVFFTNSGTEANDTALLLSCIHGRSDTVVALRGSYHGRSIATLAVTELERWRPPGPSPFTVVFASNGYPPGQTGTQDTVPVGECVADLCAQLAQQNHSRVAAMIVEPIQGLNGFREPPPGLLTGYQAALADSGALLIADEVQTGWGRTGTSFWGIQRHHVQPDLVSFAKGIGNGFALGGVIGPASVMDDIGAQSISTFGGNPVSTGAALVTLETIESRDLQANAEAIGLHIRTALQTTLSDLPGVAEVRGAGLMIAIECVRPGTAEPDGATARAILSGCRSNGALVGLGGAAGNVIRISPPMTFTTGEADRLCAILATVVRETTIPHNRYAAPRLPVLSAERSGS